MKHLREKDTRAETGERDKEGYCHEMRAEMPASLINLSTIEFYQVGPDLSMILLSHSVALHYTSHDQVAVVTLPSMDGGRLEHRICCVRE